MKFFLFFLFPLIAQGQITYTGSVINKSNKEKIPFATVGLVKENKGINADKNGKFILTSDKHDQDTLIISCIGYETSRFAVEQFPGNLLFELPEKQVALKGIVIRNRYTRSATLNDFSDCGNNFYTTSGFMTQIAKQYELPVPNALLSDVYICKERTNALFRIRVYDMDSATGKPSTDLADTIIEIRSGKGHVHINLAKYKIIIPGRYFFVAVEWLYIPYNEHAIKWKEKNNQPFNITYKPEISFKHLEKIDIDPANNSEIWWLDYRNQWSHTKAGSLLLISAKVKY